MSHSRKKLEEKGRILNYVNAEKMRGWSQMFIIKISYINRQWKQRSTQNNMLGNQTSRLKDIKSINAPLKLVNIVLYYSNKNTFRNLYTIKRSFNKTWEILPKSKINLTWKMAVISVTWNKKHEIPKLN